MVSKEEQTMIESNRMTAGSPAKHILKLAFPLMLGNRIDVINKGN